VPTKSAAIQSTKIEDSQLYLNFGLFHRHCCDILVSTVFSAQQRQFLLLSSMPTWQRTSKTSAPCQSPPTMRSCQHKRHTESRLAYRMFTLCYRLKEAGGRQSEKWCGLCPFPFANSMLDRHTCKH